MRIEHIALRSLDIEGCKQFRIHHSGAGPKQGCAPRRIGIRA
jgi:hypothetical protein